MTYSLVSTIAVGVLTTSLLVCACGSEGTEQDSGANGGSASGGSANGGTESGGATAGGSAGTSGSGPGVGGTIGLDAGSSGGRAADGGLDPDAACVSESAQGQRLAVDLYFMIDISGSMNCPTGPDGSGCEVDPGAPYAAQTRWTEMSTALKSFFGSNGTTDMGAGIAFFPRTSNGSLACNPSDYTTPDVEIALLPGAATALGGNIDQQTPGGNTPTVPSLSGAIQHAIDWTNANPGRSASVVYATDGYPRGCNAGTTNTVANAAAAAAAGYQGSPAVRTFVLGVGPNLTDLNQIATAGGTNQAFFVDTGQDVAAQLVAAFAAIQSTVTVDCTFSIPNPPSGEEIDPNKVNVRYTSGAGEQTDILRDPTATECNQGWQYSPDGREILLCGSICDTVKTDPEARVDILFGCTTHVTPPA